MDEQKNNHQHPDDCSCPMCRMGTLMGKDGHCGWHCGWGHRHGLVRVIVKLLILALVFWVGVKVGEYKGVFHSRSAYERHGFMAPRFYGTDWGTQTDAQGQQAKPLTTPSQPQTPATPTQK